MKYFHPVDLERTISGSLRVVVIQLWQHSARNTIIYFLDYQNILFYFADLPELISIFN